MKLQRIFFITIILCLFSCKKEDKPSVFINEWKSTKKPWPYFAKLDIKSDSTFSFFGGACTSKFHSSGKWKIINDTLILSSNKIDDKYCTEDFNDNCKEIHFVKPGDPIIPKKECEDSQNPNIIFRNEKFYIKNDTLKHKSKDNLCDFKNNFYQL